MANEPREEFYVESWDAGTWVPFTGRELDEGRARMILHQAAHDEPTLRLRLLKRTILETYDPVAGAEQIQ